MIFIGPPTLSAYGRVTKLSESVVQHQTINQRRILINLIKLMFGLLVLAFFFILFRGLTVRAPIATQNTLSDIAVGDTVIRNIAGERLWVSHLSAQQQLALGANNPCATRTFCALLVTTQQAGIDLVFVKYRPDLLTTNEPWFGGFVDPYNGAVYDLAGRLINRLRGSYKSEPPTMNLPTVNLFKG